MDKESSLAKDWFGKGEADLETVKILLEHEGDLGIAASHLQQALEKYMKGYLIGKGWELKRTHDLAELLDHLVEFNPQLEKFREMCEEFTAFYFELRYPLFKEEPQKEEIEDALKKAKDLIREIKEDILPKSHPTENKEKNKK